MRRLDWIHDRTMLEANIPAIVRRVEGMLGLLDLKARLRQVRDTLRFFYVQRVRGFDPPTCPHLDADTAEWLERRLQNTKLFLEFGSGGSTVLANRLAVPTISVESDRFYGAAVRKAMNDSDLTTMVFPNVGVTKQWGMPIFFRSKKGERYASAPFEKIGTVFPDFILVDGRYRVACALETARRAYMAGSTAQLMLDDYEGRPRYYALEKYLGIPERIGRAAVFEIGKIPVDEAAVRNFFSDAQ